MAPTGRKESPIDRPGQRRRAERLRRGWEERVGIAAEIIPKVSIDLGRSLSRGLWPRQLPLCKGAFGPAGGAGGHTGPPLHGHRSAQQPQAGRGRARLREHRECRSAGRCRHRPLRKNGGYGAASPLGITAVRPSARNEAHAPIPRPAAAAALPPAMPLCGEPDSRHPQQKQAPHRGPPSLAPSAQRSARARPGKSPGRGRKPLPGFRLRRKESGSFFVAACT